MTDLTLNIKGLEELRELLYNYDYIICSKLRINTPGLYPLEFVVDKNNNLKIRKIRD